MNAPSSALSASLPSCFLWEGFERGWWAELLRPLLGPQAMRFQLKPIFISPPTRIARAAFDMFFVTGAIWKDLGWSSLEFTLGVALAFAIGIPLGLAAGCSYRRFNYAVEPFLAALNATPQVAFLPLLILWVRIHFFARADHRAATRCCRSPSARLPPCAPSMRGWSAWREAFRPASAAVSQHHPAQRRAVPPCRRTACRRARHDRHRGRRNLRLFCRDRGHDQPGRLAVRDRQGVRRRIDHRRRGRGAGRAHLPCRAPCRRCSVRVAA